MVGGLAAIAFATFWAKAQLVVLFTPIKSLHILVWVLLFPAPFVGLPAVVVAVTVTVVVAVRVTGVGPAPEVVSVEIDSGTLWLGAEEVSGPEVPIWSSVLLGWVLLEFGAGEPAPEGD